MKTGAIDALIEVMRRLRDPENGCPWDKEQDFKSIAPYTIEEAYEVEDAIARDHMGDLKEELGDLLFQVVFHARIAEERGLFNFDDVAEAMTDKLIRRHPHVFADEEKRHNSQQQLVAWEALKAEERKSKDKGGLLDDVPVGLPGMTRAAKLTKRAARIGFDWPKLDDVFDKLDEEVSELKAEITLQDKTAIRAELGDVLFVLANLARKLEVEPEDAIRLTNAKFIRRFETIESELKLRGKTIEQSDLEEMDTIWRQAKQLDPH